MKIIPEALIDKFRLAPPDMRRVDPPEMFGEMGYVVAEWAKFGQNWKRACFGASTIALIGWGWLLYDAKYRTQVPDTVITAVMDVDGRVIRTFVSNRNEPAPPKVVEVAVKDIFSKIRRVGSDRSFMETNWDGIQSFLGDRALAVIRADQEKHPLIQMMNEGKTRTVEQMRVISTQYGQGAYRVFWTETEKDQWGNMLLSRPVEVWATVKTSGCDNYRLEKNPVCVVVDDIQWNIP